MGATTFPSMALAIRKIVEVSILAIERVGDDPRFASVVDPAEILKRNADAAEAADLIAELIPHEMVVRNLAKVGRLVRFPDFTNGIIGLQPNTIALLRGLVTEVHPDESLVQVKLAAHRLSTKVWIGRDDIIGIERPPSPDLVL